MKYQFRFVITHIDTQPAILAAYVPVVMAVMLEAIKL